MEKKLFIGPRLRRFREGYKLTQGEFAKRLGVSSSYWNQMENDERPLTAAVLLKIANQFSVDVGLFADDGEEQLAAQLYQTFSSTHEEGSGIHRQEVQALVRQQPELAAQVNQLLQRHLRLRDEYEQLISRFYGEQHTAHLTPLPHEEVRDFFYQRNNYIDKLDRAAETLFSDHQFQPGNLNQQLRQFLLGELGTTASFFPMDEQSGALRRYDERQHSLLLSPQLSTAQQNFQMASQIALLHQGEELESLCNESSMQPQARTLLKIGLANYFAGALLMPYRMYLDTAEQYRYDIEALATQFHVSIEQVCHRLSTLQRKNHRGVPFYFVRVDQAGNISKRQSATSFHFARTGGACPLWNVHEAFASPQRFNTQIAQMPDGLKYFCIAHTVTQGGGAYRERPKLFAIGLGCEIDHAHRLVYADGFDLNSDVLVTPIGSGCRVCSRESCSQRAFPPAGKELSTECNEHYFVPYKFTE